MTSPPDTSALTLALSSRLSAALPEPVDLAVPALHYACERFAEAASADELHALAAVLDAEPALSLRLARVWCWSEYAVDVCCRMPGQFIQMLASGEFADDSALLRSLSSPANWLLEQLREPLAKITDEAEYMRQLRRVREREQLRIIWLELNDMVALEQSALALSRMADAMLALALAFALRVAEQKYGQPIEAGSDTVAQMVVLGMGKLGAEELNLSSDIDLVFAFTEAGETRGGETSIANQEFFSRVGKTLIRLLDARTADGMVFRVDMRLRPNGQSGPLVLSFAATEDYYQQHGREWERYALIKARISAGPVELGQRLLRALQPFVFRRYLDFGAIDALRGMKLLIEQQVARQNLQDNIKLGAGGIREAEFVVQSFQLIHAGRDDSLRQANFLQCLAALVAADYLPAEQGAPLARAYRLLRRVEHALQARRDEQTQSLPVPGQAQALLAWTLGHDSYAALLATLAKARQAVSAVFADIVAVEDDDHAAGHEPERAFWQWWWQRPLDAPEAHSADELQPPPALAQRGDCMEQLFEFKRNPRVQAMDAPSRERLDRFMPLLLQVLSQSSEPLAALPRVLAVVEAVLRRSAYLALLLENRQALLQLVELCQLSPWVAEQLARYPLLLDELIDRRQLLYVPGRSELEHELQQQMLRVPAGDTEQAMDTLRQFRLAHGLRVAACQVFGILPLMRISDYLTALAEVILQSVLNLAWSELVERHGPPVRDDGQACGSRDSPRDFVIVGYGKLGGIELGPGSDLDLVFIHDAGGQADTLAADGQRSVANPVFFARLGQRIIHYLGTQTMSGDLYEVDMRLRPSGASGMLVSSFAAFERYQREQAWTWEHQALVRARVVAGDPALAKRFAALRRSVLAQARDSARLRQDVLEMRARMLSHQAQPADHDAGGADAAFDLKHSRGGMIDIEFIVQYLVLAHAHQQPGLARWTDKMRILDALSEAGILALEDARCLQSAFQAFRGRSHLAALSQTLPDEPQLLVEHRQAVTRLWHETLG